MVDTIDVIPDAENIEDEQDTTSITFPSEEKVDPTPQTTPETTPETSSDTKETTSEAPASTGSDTSDD